MLQAEGVACVLGRLTYLLVTFHFLQEHEGLEIL